MNGWHLTVKKIIKADLMRKLTDISCPLCNRKAGVKVIYDTRGVLNDELPGLILKCSCCGMTFKEYSKNLSEVYNQEYVDEYKSQEYMNGENAKIFFDKILSGSKYYKFRDKEKIRLLDIGTGTGTLLERASVSGIEAQGVEQCHGFITICRKKGLDVKEGRIEEIQFDRKYHIITMCDVIEHLSLPLASLRKVKELLLPGGEVIICTPNHNSPIVTFGNSLSFFKINNLANIIFSGKHVSFFDEASMIYLLDKTGFSLRKIFYKIYDRPGYEVSFINVAAIQVIETIGRIFGMNGYRMFVYADINS